METQELKKNKDIRPLWIYFLMMNIFPLIIVLFFSKILNNSPIIVNVSVFTVSTILFIFMYYDKLKNDFKKLNKKDIIFTCIATMGLVIVNEILTYMIGSDSVDNQNNVMELFNAYKIPMFFVIVLLGPFIEEIVFRYSLGTIITNKVVFIIISSIIFGCIHCNGFDTGISIYIIIGAILGTIYIKTNKNIVASTFAHIINNLVDLIIVLCIVN